MLEGVPQRLSVFREAPAARALLWAVVVGSVALDLTTLRQPQDQRLVTVGALMLGSLLVYGIIRLLIFRGMASEKVHDVIVQLAGFLVLFLGIVAIFALARAVTDRAFAATMAVFHASWALGALDGYRSAVRSQTARSDIQTERTETMHGYLGGGQMLGAAIDAADAQARYVFIGDDGSAHELGPEDALYLATAFYGSDGNRPYLKATYETRTLDGRLAGFLERRKVPGDVVVQPYAPPETSAR